MTLDLNVRSQDAPTVRWSAERSGKEQGTLVDVIGSDASAVFLLLAEGTAFSMDPNAAKPLFIIERLGRDLATSIRRPTDFVGKLRYPDDLHALLCEDRVNVYYHVFDKKADRNVLFLQSLSAADLQPIGSPKEVASIYSSSASLAGKYGFRVSPDGSHTLVVTFAKEGKDAPLGSAFLVLDKTGEVLSRGPMLKTSPWNKAVQLAKAEVTNEGKVIIGAGMNVIAMFDADGRSDLPLSSSGGKTSEPRLAFHPSWNGVVVLRERFSSDGTVNGLYVTLLNASGKAEREFVVEPDPALLTPFLQHAQSEAISPCTNAMQFSFLGMTPEGRAGFALDHVYDCYGADVQDFVLDAMSGGRELTFTVTNSLMVEVDATSTITNWVVVPKLQNGPGLRRFGAFYGYGRDGMWALFNDNKKNAGSNTATDKAALKGMDADLAYLWAKNGGAAVRGSANPASDAEPLALVPGACSSLVGGGSIIYVQQYSDGAVRGSTDRYRFGLLDAR